MISHLRGRLTDKDVEHAVVDVGGVGYRVFLSLTGLGRLPDVGAEVLVHTHTHVREDAFLLYGFLEPFERQVFRLLLGVNGIGPKLAINILGGIAAEELVDSVAREDLKRLQAIPGVGRKLAERTLMELRGKVKLDVQALPGASPRPGVFEDLASALVNLGYKPARVEKALDELRERGGTDDFEALLREALKLVV